MEAELKKTITHRLSRGRIDVNLQTERTEEIVYELNRPLISGYLAALKQLQDEFSLAGEPDINVIARLPNVLQNPKNDPDEDFVEGIKNALVLALQQLENMREIEGEILKKELKICSMK